MTCRVPACGYTSLRSRLSEVYNSLKVYLVALVKGLCLPGTLLKPFGSLYPGVARSCPARGAPGLGEERRVQYEAVPPYSPADHHCH